MNTELRAFGLGNWLKVGFLCLAAGAILYWNVPKKYHAEPSRPPPDHPAPLPPQPAPTAEMESEVRVTLSDDFINKLVKEGADAAQLSKIYGPPAASLSQDGVTITSYSPLIQKFHVIPNKEGRVGFHVMYKDGKPVKWGETSMR